MIKKATLNIVIALLVTLSIKSSYCQKKNIVIYEYIKKDDAKPLKKLDFKNTDIQNILSNNYRKKGYLNAFIKDSIIKKDTFTYKLVKNNMTKIVCYKLFSQSKIYCIPFIEYPKTINNLKNNSIKEGYPFTTIKTKKIKTSRDTLYTIIEIQKKENFQRHVDKIIIKGYDNFPKKYKKWYYRNNKEAINENTINKIKDKTEALPFVQNIKNPEVLFTKDSSYIYIYTKKISKNTFDGIAGLNTNENGDLETIGNVTLSLNNIFNKGEGINIHWKKNTEERSTFILELNTPYIFNSPINAAIHFKITKQDTLFSNTVIEPSTSYNINYKNQLIVGYKNETSTKLSNTATNTSKTFKLNQLNIGYKFRKTENENFFKEKVLLETKIGVGNKQEESNKLNRNDFEIKNKINWKLDKKNYIETRQEFGYINSEQIKINEQYQIGGTNSIRGFNENSLFADLYYILNVEYKFILNKENYIYTISDFGYLNNGIDNNTQKILGLGLGYSIMNKIGWLNIAYAIGKEDGNSIDLQQSKLHVKLTYQF